MRKAGDTARRAALFHALSDETRLEILRCLGSCERCVCDLTGALGAAQSRLSFHMKVLKDVGLVRDRRSGRWNYYTVVPEVLEEAMAYLEELGNAVSLSGGQAGDSVATAACC